MRFTTSFFWVACLSQAVIAVPSNSHYLKGLLGSLATNVTEANRRPDAAHPFIAPGPTDQRGLCPGLNTLANHGYIPRNGITTVEQSVKASVDVFNMGPNLATFLSTLSTAFGGNTDTDTYSIGGEDLRTYSATGASSRRAGRQYGANAHGRTDGDFSPVRADFLLANGDNHTPVPRRFRRFVDIAKSNGGSFNKTAVNILYAKNADESIRTNPNLIKEGWTFPVSLAAYGLVTYIMGNGTILSSYGGTNNYETISSLLGFELNSKGKFCTKPERLPPNWYRSADSYDFASGGFSNIFQTYAVNPFLTNSVGELFSDEQNTVQAGCFIFQSVVSSVPQSLHGSSIERVDAAIKYVQNRILSLAAPFGCNFTIPKASETYQAEGSYPQWYDDSLQEKRPGGGQKYGICE